MHSHLPATNGVPSEVSEKPALTPQIPFYLPQPAMHLVPSRVFLHCCCVRCNTLLYVEISQTLLMAFPGFITDFYSISSCVSQIVLVPLSTSPKSKKHKSITISHLIETKRFSRPRNYDFHGSVVMPRMPRTASLPAGESVYLILHLLLPTPAKTLLWNGSYLVWTETLQGIVSKLVSHIHQIIVGVDVVQAVGFCFARGFAHILAVSKETVEVEFVGVLAVCCQAGITGIHPKPNHHLHSLHTFVSLPKFNSRGAQLKPLFQTWTTDFP